MFQTSAVNGMRLILSSHRRVRGGARRRRQNLLR